MNISRNTIIDKKQITLRGACLVLKIYNVDPISDWSYRHLESFPLNRFRPISIFERYTLEKSIDVGV